MKKKKTQKMPQKHLYKDKKINDAKLLSDKKDKN